MLYTLPNGNAIDLLDVRGVSCDEGRYSAALQKCMAARVVIRTGLEHHDVSIVEFVDNPEEAAVFRDELIKLVNQAHTDQIIALRGRQAAETHMDLLNSAFAEMGLECSTDQERHCILMLGDSNSPVTEVHFSPDGTYHHIIVRWS